MKITEHKVGEELVNVWHPNKNHDQPCYQISMSSGGWLCGNYDSVESALIGAHHDVNLNAEFYEMQKRVNYFDRGNRLITISDFKCLK